MATLQPSKNKYLSSESVSTQYRIKGFTIVELLIVVVVIAILAAITIVGYNGITNRAKTSAMATELSQMRKAAEVRKLQNGIECPANYVFVYGNSALGTSDFCVMKYEAKIQGNDNGQTTYSASFVAESRPTGTPWVNINQTQAIASAQASGGQLISDAQWMTIAAEVLSVKYNWSGNEVGSGYIYSGHNDNSPASAQVASSDDEDGYFATANASDANNQKRTLYLKSGETIWDIAGNVWEWTSQQQNMSQVGVSGDSAFSWRQYTQSGLSFGNLPAASRPSALAGTTGLTNIASWNSGQGVGQIYANYADTALRGFIRGGSWNSGGYAGVLALNLGTGPTGTAAGLGFRVAR